MGKKGGEGPSVVVEDLPRTIVRRIVKDKLSQLAASSSSSSTSRGKGKAKGGEVEEGEGEGDGMILHKDALLAFSESARIFINYLSATANDICKESKRQTISAEDVLDALEEIEYPEFIGPLKVSLQDFRRKNAAKRSRKRPKADKKRKAEEELAEENGNQGGEEDEEEEGNGDGDGGNVHDEDA